jgi:small neutral amino acid transporter SnatA (MarC family)
MDFIIKLPPLEDLLTKIKIDIILAIVDRLSKYAMFILYLESTTAEQLADIIIRELVSKFGMLEEFITNRDKLFILNM